MKRFIFLLQRYIRAWMRRTKGERTLMLEALCCLAIARALVLLLPFRWIAYIFHLRIQPAMPAIGTQVLPLDVRSIGQAIQSVSPHTPWQSNCLAQALAGHWMLRRRGIPTFCYLGVTKAPAGHLLAHAWLLYGDVAVTGGQGSERFTPLVRFGAARSGEP